MTWTAQTVQPREALWSVSLRQNFTSKGSHVAHVLAIAQSETKCVCIPGNLFGACRVTLSVILI